MSQSDALADARRYEVMLILHPDLGENATMQRLDALRKQITSFPGEIFHEELWGLRDLRYQIKKQNRGYYAVIDFVADPGRIKEFNHSLGLETDVLRHMITVLPPSYTPVNYEEEAAKEKAEKEQMEPAVKPRTRKEETPRKAAPSKPAHTEETGSAPKKVSKKKEESKESLEEVDAKLKKLIDNPDELHF